MKRLILNACVGAVLSGMALAAPAEAAYDRHGYGPLTPAEHALIVRSQHQLDAIKKRAERKAADKGQPPKEPEKKP